MLKEQTQNQLIMAVFYNKVERKKPSDPNATAKWYPSFHTTSMLKGKAKGTENEADAKAAKVKKVNIRFAPGKELKESIAKIKLRQASNPIVSEL